MSLFTQIEKSFCGRSVGKKIVNNNNTLIGVEEFLLYDNGVITVVSIGVNRGAPLRPLEVL